MSIASEITRLQAAKADIKAAIENKGVTVPSDATLDDYADYIGDISGGSGGIVITDTVDAAGGTIREITAQEISGTLSITQNGTYDVTQYASAEVNVSGGGGDESFVHAVTTEEMTLKTFLAAHPIPLKYRDERCWMRLYNDNPPPSGGSFNWVCFTVQNLTKVCMDINYTNSTKSPNSMSFTNTLNHVNGNYFGLTNYQITNSGNTNDSRIIPVGTTVKVLHVPFNWSDFVTSSTEIGGES